MQSHITLRPDDVAGPDACVQRAHAVQKWSNSTTFILFVLREITGETIGNHEKGSVPAHVQKDFEKKVEHALQVFADTLEASFKEGEGNVEKH